MKKGLLYRGSIVVCGGALGVMGLSSILSGSVDVVSILLSLGGFGMVISTVHETALTSDSSVDTPDDRIVWFTTAMALITVIVGVWFVVS